MTKIRLKYPIRDFDGTLLYEVGVHAQHNEEEGEYKSFTSSRSSAPVKRSAQQNSQCQHFKEASAYAQAVKNYSEIWSFYQAEAKRQGRNPRNVAMADYLTGKDLLFGQSGSGIGSEHLGQVREGRQE